MSSHHIVRDEQEPALLILNLEAIHRSTLSSLLEWSPTIIITGDLVNQAIDIGFKVDVVVCGRDELENTRTALNNHIPLVCLTANKIELLEVVSMHLLSSNHTALSILVDSFDTFQRSLKSSSKLDLVVYDAENKWYKVHGEFKKWFNEGQELKVIGSDYRLSGVGSKYSEENEIFTVKEEGLLTITASNAVWFGERII